LIVVSALGAMLTFWIISHTADMLQNWLPRWRPWTRGPTSRFGQMLLRAAAAILIISLSGSYTLLIDNPTIVVTTIAFASLACAIGHQVIRREDHNRAESTTPMRGPWTLIGDLQPINYIRARRPRVDRPEVIMLCR
jgi:hypothetical protein